MGYLGSADAGRGACRGNASIRGARRAIAGTPSASLAAAAAGCGWAGRGGARPVVYSALDREFAAPVLDGYQRETG